MRYRVAIAAFVLAGFLTACGDDARHAHPESAPRTGRFTMTIAADGSSQNASLSASGSFDDERHVFSLVTDFAGFAPGLDGRMEMVAMPDAVFIDCPYLTRLLGAPTRWIKVSGPGGELIRTSFIDPRRFLGEVSSDGFVRRTTMRFADGADGGSALVSLEYFDIGAPVVIEPPAADQVTDETAAVNHLFGGTTGG